MTDRVDAVIAERGSQRWLQIAVNQRREVLNAAVGKAIGLAPNDVITWASPLASDNFREYRDREALRRVGIETLPKREVKTFWPQRGPVWDGLALTSSGRSIFIEAKAHIAEAASPATKAGEVSRELIFASLKEARRFYAPDSVAEWSGVYYQYANRLAHHYLFHVVNGLPSACVFVYFLNATEVAGPGSREEWQGAIKLLHVALGLPESLEQHGVHDVFIDVADLA